MKTRSLLLGAAFALAAGPAVADWPQWRGPNRDAKVTGFTAPETWPKELTKKWKVTVGDGVATPALVGDKLYVFTRAGRRRSHPLPGRGHRQGSLAGQVRPAVQGQTGRHRRSPGRGRRRRWPTARSSRSA